MFVGLGLANPSVIGIQRVFSGSRKFVTAPTRTTTSTATKAKSPTQVALSTTPYSVVLNTTRASQGTPARGKRRRGVARTVLIAIASALAAVLAVCTIIWTRRRWERSVVWRSVPDTTRRWEGDGGGGGGRCCTHEESNTTTRSRKEGGGEVGITDFGRYLRHEMSYF